MSGGGCVGVKIYKRQLVYLQYPRELNTLQLKYTEQISFRKLSY